MHGKDEAQLGKTVCDCCTTCPRHLFVRAIASTQRRTIYRASVSSPKKTLFPPYSRLADPSSERGGRTITRRQEVLHGGVVSDAVQNGVKSYDEPLHSRETGAAGPHEFLEEPEAVQGFRTSPAGLAF